MARARRRPARNAAARATSPLSSQEATPEAEPLASSTHAAAESCPGCTTESSASFNQFEKENWIRCDVCKTWYHWRCASSEPPAFLSEEDKKDYSIDRIDKWYCKPCVDKDPSRVMTLKAPARKSDRKRNYQDYASLNLGLTDPNRWIRMLENKTFKPDKFKRMHGSEVNMDWLEEDEDAMTEPILIEKPDGLGMKMPPSDFTVEDVAELVGEETPLEVIDVATQSASPGWNLGKWADYIELEPEAREKVYNVISLEVTGTKVGDMVLPPKLVRDVDWVENFWPSTRKGKGNAYPKVQLYCLMGVASAWTDWHVDFAGSSVYYHILRGSKVFYFIKPTPANLAIYERWSGTELQNSWLGDLVDEVVKVTLTEGNTMIIPSGWIHAVYTPVDTIVFGGNFLHSFAMPMQLKIRKIEIATQVPKKFRFPLFTKLCWYVGDKYLRDLKAPAGVSYPARVLTSLLALADFLVSEARILERGSDQAKKEAKDQVPSDRVKDPAAVARELRWRLRLAAGNSSDDEGVTVKPNGAGVKRKRTAEAEDERPRFKNFKPRRWDSVVEKADEDETRVVKARKPTEDDEAWKEQWVEWTINGAEGDASDAQVKSRTETIVRIRRTGEGLERQRVERVVESWEWQ
ncbi:Jumonji superfamily protein [Mycena sanguinolenta]|uniref:JmjC domain-containing histone demethylation protein 1 n=1 Tax=Mycena sanguinolenta TaxID=230812 RepID=A0A8H6YI74_9AGAR|nr:Jumonji superfamily protein [Mycena sanguinolenta]